MTRTHDDDEHGQHIEREALYNKTGLTGVQRDQLILQLYEKGLSQRQIMRRVGMTQQGVGYALMRLKGIKRDRSTYDVCDDCGDTYPANQLNPDGFCFGDGTQNCATNQ